MVSGTLHIKALYLTLHSFFHFERQLYRENIVIYMSTYKQKTTLRARDCTTRFELQNTHCVRAGQSTTHSLIESIIGPIDESSTES
jgi:hypothetical protein